MEIISRKEAKEQGLKHYFTGKPCSRGHVEKRFVSSFACYTCSQNHLKKQRQESPEKFREYDKKYYYADREKQVAKAAKWKKKNPKRYKEIRAKMYQKAKPEIYEKKRIRRKTDPDYKASLIVRSHLNRVLSAAKQEKRGRTFASVGYTASEFRAHMERNFSDGMSWDNHGDLWHVGHIIPVADFIKAGITDPRKINALSNLLPEYAEENLSKGAGFALSPVPVL